MDALILGGIFAGCVMRAVVPFLKKQAAAAEGGQAFKWETRYIWTILFALALSMVSAVYLFPTFAIPETFVFPAAFVYGWTSQDITNKVVT